MSAITYDPRERFHNAVETAYMTMDAVHSRIWTSLPGIIQSIDWNNGSPYASVKLGVMGRAIDDGQNVSFHDLPILQDCPVIFPRGGGYSLTFPIQKGDECVVFFSARSIDEFITQGKAAPAYDLRMTDLSDGMVFVGLMSQKKPLQNISSNSCQLRSDDGKNFINISDGNITIQAENEITLQVGQCQVVINSNGVNINKEVALKSDLNVQGNMQSVGNVTGAGISLNSHVHGGVKSGGDNTGAPE